MKQRLCCTFENLNLNMSHACFPDPRTSVLPPLHSFFSPCRDVWQIYTLSRPLGCSQEEEAHFYRDLHPWFIFSSRAAGHRCTSDVITSRLFAYRAAVPSKLTSEWPSGSYGSSVERWREGPWQLLNHVCHGLCGGYRWPAAMRQAGLHYCWHLTSDPVFLYTSGQWEVLWVFWSWNLSTGNGACMFVCM